MYQELPSDLDWRTLDTHTPQGCAFLRRLVAERLGYTLVSGADRVVWLNPQGHTRPGWVRQGMYDPHDDWGPPAIDAQEALAATGERVQVVYDSEINPDNAYTVRIAGRFAASDRTLDVAAFQAFLMWHDDAVGV